MIDFRQLITLCDCVGLYSVDFYLPEQGIAIEVDGPSHYIYPTLESGATSAKARYL